MDAPLAYMQIARSVYQHGYGGGSSKYGNISRFLSPDDHIDFLQSWTSKIPNHNNKHVLWMAHMQGARSVYQVGATAAANMEIYLGSWALMIISIMLLASI